MITNLITRDKEVNNLSDDTSRLAFTWLVTFADCEGRVFGDPALIRSALFPRRDDIDILQMTRYVTEWAQCGIVVWYECNDEQWIWFPKFDKNQPGLRKEREPASEIPAYNPDTCRIIAGSYPDKCPVKGMEGNEREGNGKEQPLPPRPAIFSLYEQEIGAISQMVMERLLDAEKTYPAEWFPLAFKEAAEHNARSWKYCEAILKNWKANGIKVRDNGNGAKHMIGTDAQGNPVYD